jgi:hypothetical protein
MKVQLRIDNLQGYPAAIVDRLKGLLLAGVAARPDPNRSNFYDVESIDRNFFVYASPGRDKVMLLATWPRKLASIESARSLSATQ